MADNSKQVVRICSHCQKEQSLDAQMKDAWKAGIVFTHGVCERHFAKQMADTGFDDNAIKNMIDKAKQSQPFPPDLSENPELVKLYQKGIWLPQQLQQPQQKVAESNGFNPKNLKSLKMCYMCEREFGLDSKRMPASVSHGLCPRHVQYWLERFPKIKGPDKDVAVKKIQQQNVNPAVDVREHPELIQMFAGPYTSFASTFSKKS